MELAPAIILGSLAVSTLIWALAGSLRPQRALALKIVGTTLLLSGAQLLLAS